MVMPKLGVKSIINDWPQDSRASAQLIINKYGEPDEAIPSRLIWYNNGPWKHTIVYRDTVKHNFPYPHSDGIEQTVSHEIPMEKACELVAFNGSLVFCCTRGEISACCQSEAANFLSINLAHDIILDKKTFEQARRFFCDSVIAYRQNRMVPHMERLQFTPESTTADADECVITEEHLTSSAP